MDITSLRQIKDNFVTDLQSASHGFPTSISFIKHKLPEVPLIKHSGVFQVIVIGGSISKNAYIENTVEELKILNSETKSLPAFHTKSYFLIYISNNIRPDTQVLALNFAYPLSPIMRDGLVDGLLLSGSKENRFDGLVGEKVGEEVEKYLRESFGRNVRVSVANDSICLIMSGLSTHKWSQLGAGIVGTGLNFAIFLDENTAVNIESGEFDNFSLSDEAKEIDKLSSSPGKAFFEKETSGAYLFMHFNLLAKKRNINVGYIKTSEDLHRLLTHENVEVAALAQEVIDHSASLVAVQIAGILEFAKKNITFVMQGSLFWKANGYKEIVAKIVHELSPKLRATFVEIPDADILGAAKLVT